jgi:hypothetical protein
MTVIMPPAPQDMLNAREILRLCANPEATKKVLDELRDATNVHAAELEAARTARRDAVEAEQRLESMMREIERKEAALAAREKNLAEREKDVALREGKLESLRRKIAE